MVIKHIIYKEIEKSKKNKYEHIVHKDKFKFDIWDSRKYK